MLTREQRKFLTEENGYYGVIDLPGGERWAGLYDFIFTTAIISGKNSEVEYSYDSRWCYPKHSGKAEEALANWALKDFNKEGPQGYIRATVLGGGWKKPLENSMLSEFEVTD